jgi:hypothetical protein
LTLYRDVVGVLSSAVVVDFMVIDGNLGGFGEEAVPGDNTVAQVTYDAPPGIVLPAPSARLDDLANTPTIPIVVSAVPSATVMYDPMGNVLTFNGNGHTWRTVTPFGQPIIRAVYDGGECGGQGICVYDAAGNPISTPYGVMLYHELSHAWRESQGTALSGILDEGPAIADENVLRARFGGPGRSSSNIAVACGCPKPGTSTSCFIVSAARSSAAEQELNTLRQYRDGVLRRTSVGRRFFDALHREYYVVSPRIAREMHANEKLRRAMREVAVEPLVRFYKSAIELCTRDSVSTDAHAELVRGFGPREACTLATGFSRLADDRDDADVSVSPPVPVDSPLSLVGYIAARCGPRTASLPTLRWAVLRPLAAEWRVLATMATTDGGSPAADNLLAAEIRAWLEKVPHPGGDPAKIARDHAARA